MRRPCLVHHLPSQRRPSCNSLAHDAPSDEPHMRRNCEFRVVSPGWIRNPFVPPRCLLGRPDHLRLGHAACIYSTAPEVGGERIECRQQVPVGDLPLHADVDHPVVVRSGSNSGARARDVQGRAVRPGEIRRDRPGEARCRFTQDVQQYCPEPGMRLSGINRSRYRYARHRS